MPIEFNCSQCGKRLHVPDVHAGKRARCPDCQAINNVPFDNALNEESEGLKQQTYQPQTREIELFGDSPAEFNDLTGESNPSPIDQASRLPVSNPFAINDAIPSSSRYAVGNRPPVGNFVNPHRGGLILTFGIVAVICNLFLVPGILAWNMGRHDLREIRAGSMDRRGEAMTQTGMILGIVFTLVSIGILAFCLLIFAVAIVR